MIYPFGVKGENPLISYLISVKEAEDLMKGLRVEDVRQIVHGLLGDAPAGLLLGIQSEAKRKTTDPGGTLSAGL